MWPPSISEISDEIRASRRRAAAGCGPRPSWWRPLARSIWTTRRLAVNAYWIDVAIDVFEPAVIESAAFAAFVDELREMEEVADLPRARVVA